MDNNSASNTIIYTIDTVEQIKELWTKTYNNAGKPDWSHIIPYYAKDMEFKDSIQYIKGIEDFTTMTERLSTRSNDLKMRVVNATKDGAIIFVEWEMTIIFKKRPSSIIYGASRLTLNKEGKIVYQRDYYDLWGDIFDNIPRFNKIYRKFMHRKFG
jgi:limonene-1,2-epoxide hydrolase